MIDSLYGALVRRRRRWYARHPEARRRLARPVISVGNLSVGGNSKTPLVAHLVRLLLAAGERPSVLSRGYGRKRTPEGAVVVRDRSGLRAELGEAGDEPYMLARALTGAVVVVSSDRYLAGRLAEWRLDCTVHVLDDGFQHLALERDVDLLVAGHADLARERLLPMGTLREPLDASAAADALVVVGQDEAEAARLAEAMQPPRVFRARRVLGEPVVLGSEERLPRPEGAVLAVAGIAHPGRFFADLREHGWHVAGELAFPDHHPFGPRDVQRIARAAREAGAALVLTTEKDMVRLLPLQPLPLPFAWVPLALTFDGEPGASFHTWILGRLTEARASRNGECDTDSNI